MTKKEKTMNDTENPLESNPIETTVEVASIALQAVPIAGGILSSTAMFFLLYFPLKVDSDICGNHFPLV